jgi:hypothetical protein
VIKEQQVIQKLLRVVPKHLSQVAVAIEVTQDLSKLMLEDADGRQRVAENRAMEDDDEPALLMAMVEESHDAVEPAPPQVVEPALEQQQLVHLDETKAQAFLDTGCSDDDHLEDWYLDTGATNHMTGHGNVFSELDRAVQDTIKFGDGSVVNICGEGTIIFSGRHGEHKVLTGVYWIPRLKNSIISVGQMDEGGARVLIEGGVLRVWDRRHRLLARV